MANSYHVSWLHQGPENWNLRRDGRHFVPSLKAARLSGLDLSNVNLRGAQLSSAYLSGSILRGANLIGAHLVGANFSDADLTDASLNAAVMTRAYLVNAKLTGANLDEVDLRGADLRGCDLRGAFLIGTNLTRARLAGADITTVLGYRRVNLRFCKGLTERHIADMQGDTGVLLPEGWEYPPSWPVIEVEPEEKSAETSSPVSSEYPSVISTDERYVFLSYARSDSSTIDPLRSALIADGIPLWWDRDIPMGDQWREHIDARLQAATAVLTVWTENSTASPAVKEEASRAQSYHKLVHTRLDGSRLPYGFSETQYADLRGWDGSSDNVELQKLIQSLKDKLFPPTSDELRQRLTAAAPVAAILEGGMITAKDSPPNAPPQNPDPTDLEARLLAQEALAKKARGALDALDNNMGEAIRFDIDHFISQIGLRPASWYILSDSISDLRVYLDMGDELSWPGSTRNSVENLCKNHEALRPTLQPTQPSSAEAPLPPPTPNLMDVSDQDLKGIVNATAAVFGGPQAHDVLAEPALRTGGYLAVEIDEARSFPVTSELGGELKYKKLRNGLIALAGFVGTMITSISQGVTTNALTSPEAATTLLESLKKLFEMLKGLF